MFKRIATALGAACLILALAPAAQAEVPDIEAKTTVESTLKVERDVENVSGLVALLISLGFDVEIVEFDADVDAKITVDPEGPEA